MDCDAANRKVKPRLGCNPNLLEVAGARTSVDRLHLGLTSRGGTPSRCTEGYCATTPSARGICHAPAQRFTVSSRYQRYSPSGSPPSAAILAECKVLASPFTSCKLLNVARKLGHLGSESLHSKLQEAKCRRKTATFEDLELLPLLVIDEGAFLGRNGPNMVVNIATYATAIAARRRLP